MKSRFGYDVNKGSIKTEKPTTKKKRVYAGLDASGNPIYKEQ
jgi:hypothetical protein